MRQRAPRQKRKSWQKMSLLFVLWIVEVDRAFLYHRRFTLARASVVPTDMYGFGNRRLRLLLRPGVHRGDVREIADPAELVVATSLFAANVGCAVSVAPALRRSVTTAAALGPERRRASRDVADLGGAFRAFFDTGHAFTLAG